MTGIIIELRPTGELMLLGDALVRALDRLAAAIETNSDPIRVGMEGDADRDAAQATTRLPESAPHVGSPASSGGRTPTGEGLFSPERNAIIRRDYPLGVSTDAIMARCHALPGREISRRKIAVHAAYLGVRRPVATTKDVAVCSDAQAAEPQPKIDLSRLQSLGVVIERKSSSPHTAASPTPPKKQAPQPQSRMEAIAAVSHIQRVPIDPGEPIAADFEQVRQWADQRGMAFSSWDDLPAVNRKRDTLGIATFKRRFATVGPRS